MLSATPVNNRFYDLRNQLALAYEGNPQEINEKLDTKSDIDTIFRNAQKVYNSWCKLPEPSRTTQALLSRLDFDFFEILDSVTIARSRRQIQTYYDTKDIGSFPKRNKPISLYPKLTDREGAINYKEVYECLSSLHLTIYTPTQFILPSRLSKYLSEEETENFRKGLTVQRVYQYIHDTDEIIEQFKQSGTGSLEEMADLSKTAFDFDGDDQNTDFFTVGKKVKIDLRDMDYVSWQRDMEDDLEILLLLIDMVEDITPEYDYKLNQLIHVIAEKERKR